jgi:AhpD family alkylhydroperoxidase
MSVSTRSFFTEHTIESAPAASHRTMTSVREHLGFLPSATALWAESPELLAGFSKLSALFETGTLDQLTRETIVMTLAVRNGCELCVAMHTSRLVAESASEPVIAALRSGSPIPDARLEAARVFTIQLLDTTGNAGEKALAAFLAAGYTTRQALEVVVGIGTYTMSTFANRLTGAQIDEPLRKFAP